MADLKNEILEVLNQSTPNFSDSNTTPPVNMRRRIAGFGILLLSGIALSAGQYTPQDWRWIFLLGGLLYAVVGVVMISQSCPRFPLGKLSNKARGDVRQFPPS